MGNIESGELNGIWDETLDPRFQSIDEESYPGGYYSRYETSPERPNGGGYYSRYETSPERPNGGGYTPDQDDSSIPPPTPPYTRRSVEVTTPPRASTAKSENVPEVVPDADNGAHNHKSQEKEAQLEIAREAQSQATETGTEIPKAADGSSNSTADANAATTADAAPAASEIPPSDVNISRSQAANLPMDAATVQPDGGATGTVRSLQNPRLRHRIHDGPFALLFICHILLVAMGIIYLDIVFLKGLNRRKIHNLQRWLPQLSASVVAGAAFAVILQSLFKLYPTIMSRFIIGTSAVLTAGVGIMLISTSLAANLGVGILCLIFAICQGLYASWVSDRVKYAGKLLYHTCKATQKTPGTYATSYMVLFAASVWLVFWSFGVVSALTFRFRPLVVMGLIASLAWTMETLRNVVCTTTARNVAPVYGSGDGEAHVHVHWQDSLLSALTTRFGSICLGSFIVPTLHVLRVAARGLYRVHGHNEFMFSCAECFYKVTYNFAKCANNWAYVLVGIQNRPFCDASRETWNLFYNSDLYLVIEKDLTSSFCVLSGISGGMLCAIIGGGWAFGIHKQLTLSVSVFSFLIGYFLVRITMAVPHGAVSAHYVWYGEQPQNKDLQHSPVTDRLKELKESNDAEAEKVD